MGKGIGKPRNTRNMLQLSTSNLKTANLDGDSCNSSLQGVDMSYLVAYGEAWRKGVPEDGLRGSAGTRTAQGVL